MIISDLVPLVVGGTAVIVATALLVGVGLACVYIMRNLQAVVKRSQSSLLREWAATYIREAQESLKVSGAQKHNVVSEKLVQFAQEQGIVVKQEDIEAVVKAVYNTIKGNI